MTEEIQPSALKSKAEELYPALKNPAVAHCQQVWECVHKATLKKKKDRVNASIDAGDAYRNAMPPLVGYENICNFIACVGYAMLTHILLPDTGTKLLYAAQVALSTIAPRSKTERRDPA